MLPLISAHVPWHTCFSTHTHMYIIIKHIYSTHKDKIKKKCTGEMAYWIKVLLYTPEKPESRSPGHT